MATARLMGEVSTVALIVKNDTLGYCRMNMACSSCITRPRVNMMLQAASDPHSLLCLSWRTLFSLQLLHRIQRNQRVVVTGGVIINSNATLLFQGADWQIAITIEV